MSSVWADLDHLVCSVIWSKTISLDISNEKYWLIASISDYCDVIDWGNGVRDKVKVDRRKDTNNGTSWSMPD